MEARIIYGVAQNRLIHDNGDAAEKREREREKERVREREDTRSRCLLVGEGWRSFAMNFDTSPEPNPQNFRTQTD